MRTEQILNRFLLVFSLILVFSGFMDIFLHFYVGFMVPSWTIGLVSLICGVVFLYLSHGGRGKFNLE